jgi:hypothetical protein
MTTHSGQSRGRSRSGWARALIATGAVGAVLALSAVNAIPMGHLPDKEPPPPGVQLSMPILAFDPPPSGGGGSGGSGK